MLSLGFLSFLNIYLRKESEFLGSVRNMIAATLLILFFIFFPSPPSSLVVCPHHRVLTALHLLLLATPC